MDMSKIYKISLGVLALSFLALSLLAFFFSAVIMLAPYEIGELETKIKEVYSSNLVGIINLLIPLEYKDITLTEVKLMCGIPSFYNLNISSLNLTNSSLIEERDIELVCNKAKEVSNIEELKETIIKLKINDFTTKEFAKIKQEINSYSSTYLPILVIGFLVLYLLSLVVFYFKNNGLLQGISELMFYTVLACIVYIVLLGIAVFIVSSLLNPSIITKNPEISVLLSQVPKDKQPIIDNVIIDTVDFISKWIEDIFMHLIFIYIGFGVLSAGGWFGTSIAYKIEEKKNRIQNRQKRETNVSA